MKRKLFNDDWFFSKGTATSLSNLFEQAREAKSVMLPHDAVIETEREEFPGGVCTGFYKPENIYYTKIFELSEENKGKSIWLEFEGVFQFAFVYVNDELAGKCMNGYINFYVDISKYVVFDKPNQIKVVIRNGCESSRWYSGGGIYRNVNIIIGEPMHICCAGSRITTVEMEANYALLDIVTPIEYTGCTRKETRVRNEIFDAEGNPVGVNSVPLTMREAGKRDVHMKINLSGVTPWDLDNPYLYTCRTTITEEEHVVDTYETTFGIRTLRLDAVHGFRLNGKSVKLKGGCLHHDNGVVGTATFLESEERRLRKLKKAGFNAVRTGAHPFNREVLDVCDRIGMLVYDEMYDAWTVSKVAFDPAFYFENTWEQDITSLIMRDYNHPSVILYSIGNEIQELTTPDGQDWSRKLSDKIHSLDPTRFTTLSMNPLMCILDKMGEIMESLAQEAAGVQNDKEKNPCEAAEGLDVDTTEINSAMNELDNSLDLLWKHPMSSRMTEEVCAQVDLVGLNYAAGLYENDHERYPDRVMFGSETCPKELAKNWELIEKHPYIVGDFCWTAWDYLGEAGIGSIDHNDVPKSPMEFYGSWPWKTAAVGVFDLIGDETPIGYWRELVWKNRTAPYIAVRPPMYYGRPIHTGNWNWISDSINCWNWDGFEGKPVEVEVFTCADSVELFINGKSVGVQKPGKVFKHVALFDTYYEPGEIKAVDSNGEVYILKGAENENVIKAYIDPRELENETRELTYIELSICDEKGILNAASDKKVHIEIEGDGVIQGFGSADPLSTENFFDKDITAYHGRVLAVIRHNKSHGKVKVTFTAEGCTMAEVKI